MKLAFCLFKYFPYGGLQRKMLQIAGICKNHGHWIDIFTRSWEGPVAQGLNIILVPAKVWTNHRKNEAYVRSVIPLLEKGRYDTVVGFNRMPGLDIYYAADACYVERMHKTKSWFYRQTPRYHHFARYERSVFTPEANVELMMISRVEQDHFMQWYGTPQERFHLLPPGISRDRMAPENSQEIRSQWRREFGVSDFDKVILMVGSNFQGKGLGRALVGLSALPSDLRRRTRLMMIGKDKPQPFLRMAARLGLSQQLDIFLGRDDVPRFLLGADLFVHPAYVGETAGNVILEAVVSGLPVLVTESCGYAFHVAQADAGLLVRLPYRQEDFNEKLHHMLVSDQRKTWAHNGIVYGRTENLYGLPEVAADLIEETAKKKREIRIMAGPNRGNSGK